MNDKNEDENARVGGLSETKDGGKWYEIHTVQRDFLKHLEYVEKHLISSW